MYPVTQDFLDKMKADRRQVLAKAVIDYTDPFMDQSIEISASEQANVSYPQQIADSVTAATHKWASLDGSWVLDGTYHLVPSADKLSQYQFGWWGSQLAGTGGLFSVPYPTLTVTHFPRPIHTLKVIGDTAREEYPIDFEIKLYAQDDTLLHTESIIGNTQVSWSKTLASPVLDVAKQVLTITKWSHEGRQAKIIEFFTSIRETYLTGDLISLRLLEEREASQGSLPVGNISANEVTLTLNNESKKFDVDNEQSPLYRLLKPNRKVKLYLGIKGFVATELSDDFSEDSSANYVINGSLPAVWDSVNGYLIFGGVGSGGIARKELYGYGVYHFRAAILTDRGDGQTSDDIHISIAADSSTISNGSNGFTAVLRPLTNTISFQPNMTSETPFDTPYTIELDTWYVITISWQKGRIQIWVDDMGMNSSPLIEYSYDAIKYPRFAGCVGVGVSSSKIKLDWLYAPRLTMLSDNGDYEEWVPLGTFWSLDWDSPDDSLEATVTARDRMELLRKGTYQSSQVQQNKSLYELAEAVLQDAGLNSDEYIIDEALDDIVIPYAWFGPMSHREALRRIAEAALAAVYADRDGKIRIESFTMTGTTAALIITEDEYFLPLRAPSRQDQVANEIIVDTQPLRPATVAEEVYRSNEPITISASSTKTVTAFYNSPPVIEAVASLDNPSSGVSITGATYYGWGASVTIQNTNVTDQHVTLVINGKPLTVQNKERAVARDETSITENGPLRYEFPANPLVQTLAQAQAIADTLLASVKDPRRDLEVDWRGNPALLLGDRVTVKGQDYHVIRQEIEWAGALSARLTGRRAT